MTDVDIFSYKYGQTLWSLTSENSNMQSKKDRREYYVDFYSLRPELLVAEMDENECIYN